MKSVGAYVRKGEKSIAGCDFQGGDFQIQHLFDAAQTYRIKLPAYENNLITSDIMRLMRTPGADIFIRDNIAVIVLYMIHGVYNAKEIDLNNTIMNYVSSAKAFGFREYFIRDGNVSYKDDCKSTSILTYFLFF
jgi:hypothetical protein